MTPRKLWRAVHVDEDGHTVLFVLEAPDADTAADEAEYQTGLDCVIVDDITPTSRRRSPRGITRIAA